MYTDQKHSGSPRAEKDGRWAIFIILTRRSKQAKHNNEAAMGVERTISVLNFTVGPFTKYLLGLLISSWDSGSVRSRFETVSTPLQAASKLYFTEIS